MFLLHNVFEKKEKDLQFINQLITICTNMSVQNSI